MDCRGIKKRVTERVRFIREHVEKVRGKRIGDRPFFTMPIANVTHARPRDEDRQWTVEDGATWGRKSTEGQSKHKRKKHGR